MHAHVKLGISLLYHLHLLRDFYGLSSLFHNSSCSHAVMDMIVVHKNNVHSMRCIHHYDTYIKLHGLHTTLQALLPLLKYVRGEVLSPDHWHELFRMLGMPRGTTLEKLTFGDVTAAADAIINSADGLKELYRY